MTKKVYDVLSPDGFSISANEFYDSLEAAEAAFNKWAENYKAQGYYSSNYGRIDLRDLQDECCLVPRDMDIEDLEGFKVLTIADFQTAQ